MGGIEIRSPAELPAARARFDGWTRVDTLLAVALLVYLTAAARTAISYDSHLYLASAKSLFWPGMEQWYHWIREPLYPILIRIATGLLGSADIGLVILQAAIVIASTSLFVGTWLRSTPALRRLGLVLIVANPAVIGIVGFVGQQALFLALICLSAAWLRLAVERESPCSRQFVIASAVLGAALSLSSAILMLLAVALAVYVLVARHGKKRSPAARSRMGRPATALVLSAVIALAGWLGFKALMTMESESVYPYPEWIWTYSTTDGESPLGVGEKILALLSFGRDGTIPPSPTAWELTIYGGLSDAYTPRCGFEDPGDQAADYSDGYLELTCRPAWANSLNRTLAPIGLVLHRIAMLLVVAAFPLAIVWRPARAVAVIAFAYFSPYVVAGLGVSRYGIPIYPLGVIVSLLGSRRLYELLPLRRGERTAE